MIVVSDLLRFPEDKHTVHTEVNAHEILTRDPAATEVMRLREAFALLQQKPSPLASWVDGVNINIRKANRREYQ